MLKFFRLFKLNFRKIIRTLYFVLSILIIILFLPREGKFKYEFQKGKTWMHQDLNAPFDFPVHKTEEDILAERSLLLRKFKPIFDFDTSTVSKSVNSFKKDFHLTWGELVLSSAPNEHYLNKIESLFRFVFDKCIVDPSVISELELASDATITMLIQSLAYDTPINEVYTTQQAVDYIIKQVAEITNNQFVNEEKVIRSIPLHKYISTNLTYNKETSTKLKTELLSSLSLVEGLVKAGDRIINQGEVVSNESFKVLESLKSEYESKVGFSGKTGMIIFGQALLVSILFLVLYLFMDNFRKEILEDDRKIIFILMLIILMVILSSLLLKRNIISIYIVPFAIIPIFIRTFYDSRLALFIHLVTVFLVGFFVPNSFEFVFLPSRQTLSFRFTGSSNILGSFYWNCNYTGGQSSKSKPNDISMVCW